jgi:hypothetical protein
VKILANCLANVLILPVEAEKEGDHCAYIATPRGFERRSVTVGENNEKLVEVTDGLQEGDQVALDARARSAAEAKTKGENATGPAPAPGPAPEATPTPAGDSP